MTNQSLKQLRSEDKTRGIRVLQDLATGHTSIEHEWFTHFHKVESNPYTDYYVWCDLRVDFQTAL